MTCSTQAHDALLINCTLVLTHLVSETVYFQEIGLVHSERDGDLRMPHLVYFYSVHLQIGTNLGDFQYLYIDFCLATIFVLVSK